MALNLTEQQKTIRIKELEEELNKEKHKAIFRQKMVEAAEEFGIDIAKKFGARQYEDLKKKGKQE